MGLNESKGNMYKWVTHTWNAIKGACPHDCSYCYMKKWGKQSILHFDEKELKTDLGAGNFIFVGSSCDMFAEDIPLDWITKTINHCSEYDNNYLFQTKNPSRLRLIHHDWHICTTIETNRSYPEIMRKSPDVWDRAKWMGLLPHKNKYVTIEPIMDFDFDDLVFLIKSFNPIQVNIGADSGNNNLPEPESDKLMDLIEAINSFSVVKEKKNLERLL